MNDTILKRALAAFALAAFLILGSSACHDGGSQTTSASDTSGTDEDADGFDAGDGVSSSESFDFLSFNNVALNVDDAEVLIVYEDAVRLEAGEGANASAAAVATNFWILTSSGELEPGLAYTDASVEATLENDVERIDTAPTGETYVLFENPLAFDNEPCRLFVVDTSRAVACADDGVDGDFDVFQMEFDVDGDAYYASLDNVVRKRDRATGTAEAVFDGADTGMAIDLFLPAGDELILSGAIEGTTQEIFFTEGDSLGIADCGLLSWEVREKHDFQTGQALAASSGVFYAVTDESACSELEEADAYRVTFSGGALSYEALEVSSPQAFVESAAGDVYAVVDYRDGAGKKLIEAEDDGETIATSVTDTDLFAVDGNAVYATGTGDDGYVFVRKSLATREETVISDDAMLAVESFDADASGTVYFSGNDLLGSGRFLYRYESSVQTMADLPGEVSEIHVLD